MSQIIHLEPTFAIMLWFLELTSAWENGELELKISLNRIVVSKHKESRKAFVFNYPDHATVSLHLPLQTIGCFTALSLVDYVGQLNFLFSPNIAWSPVFLLANSDNLTWRAFQRKNIPLTSSSVCLSFCKIDLFFVWFCLKAERTCKSLLFVPLCYILFVLLLFVYLESHQNKHWLLLCGDH